MAHTHRRSSFPFRYSLYSSAMAATMSLRSLAMAMADASLLPAISFPLLSASTGAAALLLLTTRASHSSSTTPASSRSLRSRGGPRKRKQKHVSNEEVFRTNHIQAHVMELEDEVRMLTNLSHPNIVVGALL